MKAVLLAGGLGTRISEESHLKPKPMIEIGGKPILWHIMKIYGHYGINDFVICLGYKGYVIKEYFANYFLHQSDVTFHIKDNKTVVHAHRAEPWTITLVDTGMNTMTGGRLKRVADYLDDEPFCFTYGDGVADIDIPKLLEEHKSGGRLATMTAVYPPSRYGALSYDENNMVTEFTEKPPGQGGLINGGFFVLSPEVIKHIDDDSMSWEREPLTRLVEQGELGVHIHKGFWQPMDTLREKMKLDELCKTGQAPWMVWD